MEESGLDSIAVPSVMDVGCATGDLAFELAEKGCRVTGIDLDKDMIGLAKSRKMQQPGQSPAPDFIIAGMTDIASVFKSGTFDAVDCFGNTLPHLASNDEVLSFFSQVRTILKPGGRFIFQIINFDIIPEDGRFDFPSVETDSGTFRRSYRVRPDGRLDFIIGLSDRRTGEVKDGSTPLLPLKRKKLIQMLEEAKFTDLRIYSGYDRIPADGTETSSIYSVKNDGRDKTNTDYTIQVGAGD